MKTSSIRSKLYGVGVKSIALKVLGAGLSVIGTGLLARVLGIEEFGVYAFSLALLSFFSIPIQAGLPQLVLRETAAAMSSGNIGMVAGIWRWSSRVIFIFGAFSTTILCVVIACDPVFLKDYRATLIFGAALPVLLALSNVRGAALRALKCFISALFVDSVLRHFLLIVFILLLYVFVEEISPERAMLANLASITVCFFYGFWLLNRRRPWGKESRVVAIEASSKWWAALIPMSMISGLRLVNSHLDIMMLGYLATAESVGSYKAMFVLAAALLLPIEAINGVISPYIASLHSSGKVHTLQRLVSVSTLIAFLVTLLPAALLVFYGNDIVVMIYGGEYSSGVDVLLIMLLGQVVNAFFGPVALLLNMSGFEKFTLKGVGISSLANVVLNLILIPAYGAIGAAIATAITMSIWNGILWVYVVQNVRIRPTAASLLTMRRGSS